MNLNGNTILITGGATGIGFEMARVFLQNNNKVIITGRTEKKLQKAKEILKDVVTIRNDVSDPDDIKKLFQRVEKDFPDLNILINNAGIMLPINLLNHTLSAADLTQEIDINLKGTVWVNDAFLQFIKAKKNAAIVIVSSGLAFVPLAISPVYCASKAGLHSYAISLREQLRNSGVKVFELAPPATKTELLGESEEYMKGIAIMPVQNMVAVFQKCFSKDIYEICPGQSGQLKFMNRFFPKFILKQLSKSVEVMQAKG